MFYDLTQLCNHVWSGGGVGDAGEIKTISGEHFPVNIPYFAWDDLEPPPQTSVGFRTTLWEPQRGAACLPACLPRRSHRPRKYLGASAKRRLNLFCFPPFRLLLLLLPLLLVLFPHTHTHTEPVVSVEWEGNNSSPCPSPLLSARASPSLLSVQHPGFQTRWQSRRTRERIPQVCCCQQSRGSWRLTHTHIHAHTHLEITTWLDTWAWRKSPILKPETLLLRSCPGRLSTGIDNRQVAPCFLRNSAFPGKKEKKKDNPPQDAWGE